MPMPKLKRIELSKSFRPIDVSFLKEGDTITFDCYVQRFYGFVIVIEAGTVIAQKHFKILQNAARHYVVCTEYEHYLQMHSHAQTTQVKSITKKELKNDGLASFETTDAKLDVLYRSAIKEMEDFFQNDKKIDQEYLEEILYQYILFFKKDASIFRLIMNTMSREDKHAVHAVNVALLGLALGNFFNYTLSQMKFLALAAVLHDIGEKEVDGGIYAKSVPLSRAELEQIQTHPSHSYYLALEMGIANRAILDAIKSHHEFVDGSGYPEGLRGQRISDFTQIITISDIFDGMSSKRTYHNKKSALETLKTIKTEFKNKLRPKIVDGLIRLFQETYAL
jgi:HD-GYP domain-containing protein (c-di-GMP phosphodiesterase class II)